MLTLCALRCRLTKDRSKFTLDLMKTKDLKINGETTTGVLVAGGHGFKIYSTPKVEGWVVAAGRKIIIVEKDAPDFGTLSRYLTLPYQPRSEQSAIKDQFQIFLKTQATAPESKSDAIN